MLHEWIECIQNLQICIYNMEMIGISYNLKRVSVPKDFYYQNLASERNKNDMVVSVGIPMASWRRISGFQKAPKMEHGPGVSIFYLLKSVSDCAHYI